MNHLSTRIAAALLLLGACSGGSDTPGTSDGPPGGHETVSLPLEQTYSLGVGEGRGFDFVVQAGAEYTVVYETDPEAAGEVHLFDPSGEDFIGGDLPSGEEVFTAVSGTYRFEIRVTAATELHLHIYKSKDASDLGEMHVTLPFNTQEIEVPAAGSRKFVFTGAPGLVVQVFANKVFPGTTLTLYSRGGEDLLSPHLFPPASPINGLLTGSAAVEEDTDYIVEVSNANIAEPMFAQVIITPSADASPLSLQGRATVQNTDGPGTSMGFTFEADAGDVVNYGAYKKCDGNTNGGGGSLEGDYATVAVSGTQGIVVTDFATVECPQPATFYVWADRLAPARLGAFDYGTLDPMGHIGVYLDFATDTLITGKNAGTGPPCEGYLHRSGDGRSQLIRGDLSQSVGVDNMVAPAVMPAGRSAVEMFRFFPGSCAGTLYLRAIADPADLGSVGSARPALTPVTTTLEVGDRKFYKLTVTDALAGKHLKITAVGAGWANLVIRAAGEGQPFYAPTTLVSGLTDVFFGGVNVPRVSAAFALAAGTYYIETYGNIYSGADNDVTSTFTWDIE